MAVRISELELIWCCARLSAAVTRVIRAWFELVDEDGSGGLDASELEGALRCGFYAC